MLDTLKGLSIADLQNVDARSARTKDVVFILAYLKQKVNEVHVNMLLLHVS